MNLKLQCAIHNDLTVEIKYFQNHDYLTMKGKIDKIDSLQKRMQLSDQTEIALSNILDVM